MVAGRCIQGSFCRPRFAAVPNVRRVRVHCVQLRKRAYRSKFNVDGRPHGGDSRAYEPHNQAHSYTTRRSQDVAWGCEYPAGFDSQGAGLLRGCRERLSRAIRINRIEASSSRTMCSPSPNNPIEYKKRGAPEPYSQENGHWHVCLPHRTRSAQAYLIAS